MPYTCDAGDGQNAVMLITDLTDGSVQALCGPHIPSWVAELYGSFSAAGVYDEPTAPNDTPDADTDTSGEDGAGESATVDAAPDGTAAVAVSEDAPPF